MLYTTIIICSNKKKLLSQSQQLRTIIPSLGRQRQAELKLKVNLVCMSSSRPGLELTVLKTRIEDGSTRLHKQTALIRFKSIKKKKRKEVMTVTRGSTGEGNRGSWDSVHMHSSIKGQRNSNYIIQQLCLRRLQSENIRKCMKGTRRTLHCSLW